MSDYDWDHDCGKIEEALGAMQEQRDGWKARAEKAERELDLAKHDHGSCSMLAARLVRAEIERDSYLAKLTRLGDCSPMTLASNPPQVLMMRAEWVRAVAVAKQMADALERVEPFLPILDTGPARYSEHAQAAGLARAALQAYRKAKP